MSGGVDSSVAALLLAQQGYDVIGITMRLWTLEQENVPKLSKRCCSVEDVEDARRVCQVIGVPHYVQNFEREFQEHVVDYFLDEYDRGRTPHPCLACNDRLKFDFLLRRAIFLDADYVATGHYARVRQDTSGFTLLKGVDPAKDQSYVLFTLGQSELGRLLLPVGEHPKGRIREIAKEANLPVADKPDSQDICFIPHGDYRRFVTERRAPRPGQIVAIDGTVLGEHAGIHGFTVGQRRKLGLNGDTGVPKFVVRIDAPTSEVVLGDAADLLQDTLWASRVNYTNEPPEGSLRVSAKIRYKATEAAATLVPHGDWAQVRFDAPQRAVTPGQPVVFYNGDEAIGGGYIELQGPSTESANAAGAFSHAG